MRNSGGKRSLETKSRLSVGGSCLKPPTQVKSRSRNRSAGIHAISAVATVEQEAGVHAVAGQVSSRMAPSQVKRLRGGCYEALDALGLRPSERSGEGLWQN